MEALTSGKSSRQAEEFDIISAMLNHNLHAVVRESIFQHLNAKHLLSATVASAKWAAPLNSESWLARYLSTEGNGCQMLKRLYATRIMKLNMAAKASSAEVSSNTRLASFFEAFQDYSKCLKRCVGNSEENINILSLDDAGKWASSCTSSARKSKTRPTTKKPPDHQQMARDSYVMDVSLSDRFIALKLVPLSSASKYRLEQQQQQQQHSTSIFVFDRWNFDLLDSLSCSETIVGRVMLPPANSESNKIVFEVVNDGTRKGKRHTLIVCDIETRKQDTLYVTVLDSFTQGFKVIRESDLLICIMTSDSQQSSLVTVFQEKDDEFRWLLQGKRLGMEFVKHVPSYRAELKCFGLTGFSVRGGNDRRHLNSVPTIQLRSKRDFSLLRTIHFSSYVDALLVVNGEKSLFLTRVQYRLELSFLGEGEHQDETRVAHVFRDKKLFDDARDAQDARARGRARGRAERARINQDYFYDSSSSDDDFYDEYRALLFDCIDKVAVKGNYLVVKDQRSTTAIWKWPGDKFIESFCSSNRHQVQQSPNFIPGETEASYPDIYYVNRGKISGDNHEIEDHLDDLSVTHVFFSADQPDGVRVRFSNVGASKRIRWTDFRTLMLKTFPVPK